MQRCGSCLRHGTGSKAKDRRDRQGGFHHGPILLCAVVLVFPSSPSARRPFGFTVSSRVHFERTISTLAPGLDTCSARAVRHFSLAANINVKRTPCDGLANDGLGDNLSIDAKLGFAADVSRSESGEGPP